MSTTSKRIDQQVTMLNNFLMHCPGDDGHIKVEIQNPGDGLEYRLTIHNGSTDVTPPMTAYGLNAYLYGVTSAVIGPHFKRKE